MINSLLLWHSFGQIEIPDKVFKINVCFIDTVIILIDLYICHYSITNQRFALNLSLSRLMCPMTSIGSDFPAYLLTLSSLNEKIMPQRQIRKKINRLVQTLSWYSRSITGCHCTRLPPTWHRFDSGLVKLVVGSLLCSESFFSGFTLSSKVHIFKFQFDQLQDLLQNHFRASVVELPE